MLHAIEVPELHGLTLGDTAFANAVALFQVSIALGAIAALTRNRMALLGSLLVGLAGSVLFAWNLLA